MDLENGFGKRRKIVKGDPVMDYALRFADLDVIIAVVSVYATSMILTGVIPTCSKSS